MTWDRVAIVENRLDTYLAGAEPAGSPLAPHAAAPPRDHPHGRRRGGAVRGPARLEADRRRCPRAEEDRPQLLHDQLGRARGQRDHRRAAAHGRPGVPALPLGRILHGPFPSARRHHADARHAARDRRLERGPDRPGPPQGVGQPAAVDPAPDEHDREPPAEGDGPRLQPGPREAHRRRDRPAGGRRRRLLIRRREREPRHRPRRDQHGALRRAHGVADAPAARVRGQRHRHQRADARGLDRVHVRWHAPPPLHRGRRRARRNVDRRRDGDRPRPRHAPARLPPPADRAAVGARRKRCRADLSVDPADRGGRGTRPARAQRAAPRRARRGNAGRAAGPRP